MENQNGLSQTSSQSTSPQPSNFPSQLLSENKPHSSFLTSKLFLITLVLVILFAIVYSGIYLSLNSKLNQITKSNPAPTIASQPSPTPAIDETANWKTYTSEEYGYSIKYPEFLTYNSRTDESFNGICKSTSDTWKGVQYTIAIVISKEGQCSGLEFNIRPKPEETIALLNQNVKQLTAMDESLIHIGPVKNKSRDYMLIYRSSVNNKPDSTIFYQILSTFRFTDQ